MTFKLTTQIPSVLILDDDPVFSAFTEAVLLDAGCTNVAIADDGEQGIRAALASSGEYDIVILDLNMPDFDGLSALRLLGDSGFNGEIVIVSGESRAIMDAASRLAGLHGLRLAGALSKPLRQGEIEGFLANFKRGSPPKAIALRQAASAEIIRLVPVFQPKVVLASQRVYGAEALMRVQTKDGRLGSPQAHLEMLSKSGQLGSATLEFLGAILDEMNGWDTRMTLLPVSVNVPAPLLEEDGFMARFTEIVREKGVSPSRITVEMTEAELPNDFSKLVEIMTRLRMAGFGLAIDDYGTGMANYDILRLCPFTELKIDRSVVQAATHDALACGFIGNCASIARELSMTVVSEGVETAEQAEAMRRLGVDVIQGYFFSKPLDAAQYRAILKSSA